ncbi:MAG: TerC/Alx family metal homeostasis membrane protein [Pseudonocardiales bacterium]|nr:TerC/Alx family metal homeostasis membrane protein [Pseudonocardiales bacterium]
MRIPEWAWLATIVGLFVIMVIDLVVADWRRFQFMPRDAVRWIFLSILFAVLFCSVIWVIWGGRYAGQFLAVYLTEYSLSADNLLVVVLIMSTFAVPEIHRHQVLVVGMMLALLLRAAAITVGVAAIQVFGWVFYLFGAFLIYTAWKVITSGSQEDPKFTENIVLRALRAVLPVTGDYHGSRLLLRLGRKVWVTPLLLVVIAIGTTDLLFAVDSIPAAFGLTREPFLVFTANAFALTGLRQLYFVVSGLVTKLAYLAHGLAVILGFVGGKLILETLHGNTLPFLNKGHPVPVPTVGSGTSLVVIVITLTVAVLASAWKVRSAGRAACPELDSLDSRAVREPAERL